MSEAGKAHGELLTESEEPRPLSAGIEQTFSVHCVDEAPSPADSVSQNEQRFTMEGEDRMCRLLLETMNEGAALLAADGVILYCNSSFATLLKTKPEKVIGTVVGDWMAPADLPTIDALLRQARENCGVQGETRLKVKDGIFTPVRLSVSALAEAGEREVFCVAATDLTGQKRHEKIASAERLARTILEQTAEAIVVCDGNGWITRASQEVERLCGEPPLLRHFDAVFPLRREDGSSFLIASVLVNETFRNIPVSLERDGRVLYLLLSVGPLVFAHQKTPGTVVTLANITESKKKEEELSKLNRTLRALNVSNQAMMRAVDESEYLNEVCRIIVEYCGHTMVWIGYAEEDEDKTVRPVVQAGFDEGYIESLRLTWADTERGRGPTGTAIRTGKASICRNILSDPNFAPWREEALKRGYASSIVLPLMADGKAFGGISIYAREPDSFTEDEVRLLTELAGDLAYGIKAIRLRGEKTCAEAALRESEERLRLAFCATNDAIWDLNLLDNTMRWNESYTAAFGSPPSSGDSWQWWADHIHPGDRERTVASLRKAIEGQDDHWACEYRFLRVDGVWTDIYDRAYLARDAAGKATRVIGSMLDITERKRIEDALRFLMQCGYTASGEDFFHALARYLAQSLSMDFVCVDRLQEGLLTAQTVAVYCEGKFEDNVTYSLMDTPCGEVVNKKICCFPKGVRHLFPKDVVLQSMLAESYVGTTLWSSQGHPIGLIAIIGRQPLKYPHLTTSILQMVAVRAAGELERRQAEEQLRASVKEKEMLLRELSHRTKNNMNVISSLLTLQASSIKDPQTLKMLKNMQGRILTMSLVHEKLYKSSDLSDVDVSEYLKDLTDSIMAGYKDEAKNITLSLDIESHTFSIDDAIPCGLIINELMTNSLKYAFPAGRTGEIRISLRRSEEGELTLRYTDNGVGFPEGFDFKGQKSLGIKLVYILATKQLRGEAELIRDKGSGLLLRFKTREFASSHEL